MCVQTNAGSIVRSFRGRAGGGQSWPARCVGAWVFLAVCAAAQVATADSNAGECRVENLSLNRISSVFDGNWQGIAVASDGRCYFGSSTHAPDRGAGFFRFDPETGELKVLAEDLTVVAGYDPADTVPQGKVHSPIVEADGWLYFTTHLANYWPEAQERFPGAHVMGYHLETETFRDFGVVRPRFSIYSAIAVDPERGRLYVFVVPFAPEDVENDGCYVYRIDIRSGEKTNLGRVGPPGRHACFWMFIDRRGDCWLSIWRDGGNVYRIEGETGEIVAYRDVLPEPRQAFDGAPVPERRAALRSWTWLTPLPDRERALFTMGLAGGNDERLWIFDPGRPVETGEAFTPVADIGATFLSVALGGDRVYFVQYRNLEDARQWMPELLRDHDPEQIDFPAELHLRSVSIAPGDPREVTDHGRLVDARGRVPRMIESLAADAHGRVLMVGSWTIDDPAEATRQYIWEGQPFWPDAEPRTFKQMQRGEFFGHVHTRGSSGGGR